MALTSSLDKVLMVVNNCNYGILEWDAM